mgnify:CR=1 FL=1
MGNEVAWRSRRIVSAPRESGKPRSSTTTSKAEDVRHSNARANVGAATTS